MSEPTRLRQMPGGWLLARDLNDEPRLPALRLSRHHVAGHRTWGVSTGLRVSIESSAVAVTPGCAVDRCGRIAILATPVHFPVPAGLPVSVLLGLCGDGPRARVRLRQPSEADDFDIPLATIDAAGRIQDGDGDRKWLRRPGPAIRLGGLISRGAAVTPNAAGWSVHVNLTAHRLAGVPAVFACAATAPSAGVWRTAVEVSAEAASGFDVIVRYSGASGVGFHTAPHAVAWLAVLPADRPEVPEEA